MCSSAFTLNDIWSAMSLSHFVSSEECGGGAGGIFSWQALEEKCFLKVLWRPTYAWQSLKTSAGLTKVANAGHVWEDFWVQKHFMDYVYYRTRVRSFWLMAIAWSVFCHWWCSVEVMKLNLGRDSEARFGQYFEVQVAFMWILRIFDPEI